MSATRAMTPAEAMAAAGDERNTVPGQSVALHVDGDGSRLTAERWHHRNGITLSIDNGSLVDVDALEIPAITMAMYEACGQEPPVMLGRPEVSPNGTVTALGRVYPFHSGKGQLVAVSGDNSRRFLQPHDARQAAAVLVAYADAAAPEPDPAEVDALARTIHAGRCNLTVVPGACDDCRAGARSALLAGWKREAGHG